MFSKQPTKWVMALCLATAAAAYTHSAMADSSKSDSERIDNRLTKNADDHLKNNLSKEDERDSLRKQIVRAEALHQMAATLAKDPKFAQAYATLIENSPKRKKDVMPSDEDVVKEKSNIINDEEAMRLVMAQAMTMLNHDKK